MIKNTKFRRLDRKRGRRRFEKRSGALLIAVLACIGIALLLTMTALQTSLNQRRQLRRTLQLEQTRLLLEAAVDSPVVAKWRKAQGKKEKPKPLKIEFELPTGNPATITAVVEPDSEKIFLTALIGDAENKISVTRRSKRISKDD